MVNFDYQNDYTGITIHVPFDDEKDNARLVHFFAQFVDFTRMIGYQSGSWDNVLGEISEICDEGYSIYDWATDVITDYSVG